MQTIANELSHKFQIFDPLDRRIPEDDIQEENQATSRDAMVELIVKMQASPGNIFDAPFTQKS